MIYFLQARTGSYHIKIGTTVRLTERIKQLTSQYKTELLVLAVMDGGHAEERAIHSKFETMRAHGEWFIPHPAITDFIAMEGRPWDGQDEIPSDSISVKLRTEVVKSARVIVAVEGNTTLTDLISDILKPILARMEEEALASRTRPQNGKPRDESNDRK